MIFCEKNILTGGKRQFNLSSIMESRVKFNMLCKLLVRFFAPGFRGGDVRTASLEPHGPGAKSRIFSARSRKKERL